MKAHFRTANGRIVFELEAGSAKEMFARIADVQEIFEADSCCGVCKKTNIIFRVRDAKTQAGKVVSYHEIVCTDCGAKLSFGQSQDMLNLFPKRKDTSGEWMPNRGWYRYTPAKED